MTQYTTPEVYPYFGIPIDVDNTSNPPDEKMTLDIDYQDPNHHIPLEYYDDYQDQDPDPEPYRLKEFVSGIIKKIKELFYL